MVNVQGLLENAVRDIENAINLLPVDNSVIMLPPIHTGKQGTLREEQSKFVLAVSRLIQFAYSQGYELTFGDAYRDKRVHGELGEKIGYSAANSKHKIRLAIDLNLFKDGIYYTDTSAYKALGDWWLYEYPTRATWGGKWGDGNHFSWMEF